MLTDAAGVEVLVAEQCLALLATASVGRIAVTIGAVPAIFPVRYQLVEGQIVFRVGKGTNLHTASANTVVAFEVDDVDPSWAEGWSVLVVGVARDVRDGTDLESSLEQSAHLWDSEGGGRVVAVLPAFLSGRRFTRAA